MFICMVTHLRSMETFIVKCFPQVQYLTIIFLTYKMPRDLPEAERGEGMQRFYLTGTLRPASTRFFLPWVKRLKVPALQRTFKLSLIYTNFTILRWFFYGNEDKFVSEDNNGCCNDFIAIAVFCSTVSK